uniref:Uncharacterized protein n=1 Tax=Acrobeloides nanus TaxID=290746 RepID=A0A914DHD9_9BILA
MAPKKKRRRVEPNKTISNKTETLKINTTSDILSNIFQFLDRNEIEKSQL